ncbi:MAG: DsbA family protein [Nitrospirota bacterium]|nr:DsbA family protein [Nitrospirota bacterium]
MGNRIRNISRLACQRHQTQGGIIMATLPQLAVTVFSDYVCPFCYVGERRLNRLAARYDLQVTWRMVEIHPQTPLEGMPLEALGYPPDVWERMMVHLTSMAAMENIALFQRTHTYNSHKALLLAEAAREEGPAVFRAVHEGLFAAYLSHGRNLAESAVLEEVSRQAGMERSRFEQALIEPRYEERLRENFAVARRAGVTGVPAFLIGDRLVSGAVPVESLVVVAEEALLTAG